MRFWLISAIIIKICCVTCTGLCLLMQQLCHWQQTRFQIHYQSLAVDSSIPQEEVPTGVCNSRNDEVPSQRFGRSLHANEPKGNRPNFCMRAREFLSFRTEVRKSSAPLPTIRYFRTLSRQSSSKYPDKGFQKKVLKQRKLSSN